MKYTININQKELSEIAPNITYEEAALLDYLIDMCFSDNKAINDQRIDDYTWINYAYLFKEMPLLKGKTKGSLSTKLKKLEEYGFINTAIMLNKHGNKRKYIKLLQLTLTLYGNGEEEISMKHYHMLKNEFGVNEIQARIIASDIMFFQVCSVKIRSLKDNPEQATEGPAAFLWGMYRFYCYHRELKEWEDKRDAKSAEDFEKALESFKKRGLGEPTEQDINHLRTISEYHSDPPTKSH